MQRPIPISTRLRLLLVCLWTTMLVPVSAQFYNGSQISFGKNRVQHQQFNWQYMRANQYDVYFYPTGKALAQYAFYKIPEVIREVETLLNYTSKKKIQFVVYNTQQDFRESNFAYDDDDFYNQGGVTNIYGTKVYLYFDGNREHFDRMIRAGIMDVYAHWVVQGATMGSNISADYLIRVPQWYYSGLSSFFGQPWYSELDAHLKDGIFTQRYADFDELSAMDATYAGHAFWKYVCDIYGDETLAKVLYFTRSTKSVEKGFMYATGVNFRQLLVEWYKYYFVMYYPDKEKQKPEGNGWIKHPRIKRHYTNFCTSPVNDLYAYVTNEGGQIRVWLKTATQERARCIFKKYAKIEDYPDLSFPILAWHPSEPILGMTLEDKGHCYYYPYNVEEKKWEKRFLVDIEKITSWTYSPDGKMMLLSGFKNGQSDIYLYSFLSRSYQNITQDFYDDYNPVFLNSKQIVFASNRDRDSIRLRDNFMEASPQKNYDLFLYDYEKKEAPLLRITQTPYAQEHHVLRIDDQKIVYLGNDDGLVNRYQALFDSTISRIDTAIHYAFYAKTEPLTDNAYSIVEQSYDVALGSTVDIILKDKVKRIFFTPLDFHTIDSISRSAFRNKLRWEEIRKEEEQKRQDSVKLKGETTPLTHGFVPVLAKDTIDDSSEELAQQEGKEEFYIPVAQGYKVQYTINKLITQADFSFLNTSYQQFEGGKSPIYLNTGFNALFMLGITDLFEDYRITGGFRLSYNMQSNEFMFSYENLSRRLDRQIVLYRQSIGATSGNNVHKQTSNSLFYILKFPFNRVNSLRLSLKGRYETHIVQAISDHTLRQPNKYHLWGGAKLEYIFDSSRELDINLWRGTKINLFAEYEQRAEKETQNLFVIGVDARRSFKLYKNMTFAVRAAASSNVGSARLVYFMGGVDNWINAKFNSSIWVDQSKNYVYQTLATNLRGFQQNIRNGTSFVLLSAEWRVPFVQLIMGRRVSYEFLNSLQLNIFGDVGTAWTGITPYSKDNCLYTRYVESGPISVMIRRQVEPFVGGFGAGIRCSLLGYFLRFDYAWGVEDFKIKQKKGMFLFSIGTDF